MTVTSILESDIPVEFFGIAFSASKVVLLVDDPEELVYPIGIVEVDFLSRRGVSAEDIEGPGYSNATLGTTKSDVMLEEIFEWPGYPIEIFETPS